MTNTPNTPQTPNSLIARKRRAYLALRMMPEFHDDPRIDDFARELLADLESLNDTTPALFDLFD